MSRNARFWVYMNGSAVKLTLRPGQTLRHFRAWNHNEGWSSESEQWTHEGDCVRREWCNDGCDCDGPLTRYGEDSCRIEYLRDGDFPCLENSGLSRLELAEWDGVQWPDWRRVSREQRDVYAEAAGY